MSFIRNIPYMLPETDSADSIMESYLRIVRALQMQHEERMGRDGEQECSHEFRQYTGLRESFSYCVKCDHKISSET